MAFPTITRTTWTDAPPDASATVINNSELQLIYDKIDNLVTRIITVRKNSTGTQVNQGMLNFIEGTNVTLTVAEDTGNSEVDITIAAAGGATADEIWDEAISGHSSSGTTGKALTDVLADTNSLQGEWANGGRLDLLLDKADVQSAAFVDEAYDVQWVSVSDDMTGTGTTNAVSVTERGILLSIAARMSTGLSGAASSNIEIVIDGGTTRTLPVFSGGDNWMGPSGLAMFAAGISGDAGPASNDRAAVPIGAKYATSLRVGHNISSAASGGALVLGVLRGTLL